MRPADEILLSNARRTVDLPGYLAARGWTVGSTDSRYWRRLDGPDGQRLLVRRVPASGDWVWSEAHRPGDSHTLYDLIRHLDGGTHGQIMAAIRRAVATPPPALERGSRTPRGATTHYRPRPPRSLPLVDDAGTAYLIETRSLHPDTVAAFAHSLGSLPGGVVVAIHNQAHDGEEKGPDQPGWFTGAMDDGPGRGRSLYLAAPYNQGVPKLLVVADSFIDALSAWEAHDAELRPTVGVASTGGGVSAAGDDKLRRTLTRMVQAHGEFTPVLLDASDVGEKNEAERAVWLQEAAAEAGVEYRRIAPVHGKDWNEWLATIKREAQEAASAAEKAADWTLPDEPDEPDGPRVRGRGR